MTDQIVSGMLFIAGYVALTGGSVALILWMQRRFFLSPDQEQSLAVPAVMSFFMGLLYLWMVISADVH